MRNHLPTFAVFLSVVLIFAAAPSAYASSFAETDPLFADDTPLVLKLEAPIRKITRDRASDPEDRPGKLGFTNSEGEIIWFDVGVRPRGKSRRDKQVCQFPPIRLNFKTKQVEGSVFAHQDKLKLVTHCKKSPRYKQYLLVEYLAYKTLNLLTDNSFKVRLVTIQYLDGEKDRGTYNGFFIEHKKRLAERIGHPVEEPDGIAPKYLEPEQASIVELYQFMIGNTDFSFLKGPTGDVCCHNSVLFESDGKYQPIPYDFDVTGLVNPPYAQHNEDLGQRKITQRVFRGFCRSGIFTANALHLFKTKKSSIYELFSDVLRENTRKRTRAYLDSFYAVIENPEQLDRKIFQKCR